MIYVYSSFTFSYLSRARVLANSLKRHHPEWTFVAVITDLEPEGFSFDLDQEPFDEVLAGQQLLGSGAFDWLFRHDIVEVCTGVKGLAARSLLARPDCRAVIYLDPDTAVFNSLQPIIDILDGEAIVLTPHQLRPEADLRAIMDNEIAALNFGVYNLGFLALGAAHPPARAFADWWTERLDRWCVDDRSNGIFVDQKWCDLAPALFEGVHVLRDPGCNVASWNLSNREIRIADGGQILCNDTPLRFYHFTKMGTVGETMTARYAKNNTAIYELWAWYRNEVAALTDPAIPNGWWGFNTFDDGAPIDGPMRRAYAERDDVRRRYPNPFETGTDGGYRAWYHNQMAVAS